MNKTLFIIAFLGGFVFTACSKNGTDKDEQAPEVVQKAFDAKFPNAKSVEWDKENDQEWEAEFKMDGKSYSANFSLDGTWLETESEMKAKDLPAKVQEAITTNFSGYKIESAELAESPERTAYEVEIQNDKETLEVVFDANGNVLKKKQVEEEDEDEEDED